VSTSADVIGNSAAAGALSEAEIEATVAAGVA